MQPGVSAPGRLSVRVELINCCWYGVAVVDTAGERSDGVEHSTTSHSNELVNQPGLIRLNLISPCRNLTTTL